MRLAEIHMFTQLPPDPHIELLVGVDFNVNPMTAAIGYRKEIDGEMHYFFLPNTISAKATPCWPICLPRISVPAQ